MKRHLILLFVGVSLPFLLAAQQKNSVSITKRVLRIPEVTVVGKRPMKDIGVQRTRFDSIAMKENIALSMADVLTFNSSVFVKNYGRATLSTVAFRGTSPSHTQVTWNGMRINNPMLGMTDFSTIPSYFIDDASLLHGTSSVNETGGGLGGLVRLSTSPANHEGFGLQYVQGVGSFSTFDEFLRLTYGDKHWQSSTRVVYSSSPNDYKYRNRDKKENIYDEDKNIIGSYYPTERNRSGAYKDLVVRILVIRHVDCAEQGNVLEEIAQCHYREFAVRDRVHISYIAFDKKFLLVLVLPVLHETLDTIQKFLDIRGPGLTLNRVIHLERSIKPGSVGKQGRNSKSILGGQSGIGIGNHIMEFHDFSGRTGFYAGGSKKSRCAGIEKGHLVCPGH